MIKLFTKKKANSLNDILKKQEALCKILDEMQDKQLKGVTSK